MGMGLSMGTSVSGMQRKGFKGRTPTASKVQIVCGAWAWGMSLSGTLLGGFSGSCFNTAGSKVQAWVQGMGVAQVCLACKERLV